MRSNPLLVLALAAHLSVTLTALWMVAGAALPLVGRGVLGAVLAAFLLPGIATLAANRAARFTRVALVLVVVIGAAIVEVVATSAQPRAAILLGSATLEFALLVMLSRRFPRRERTGREQR